MRTHSLLLALAFAAGALHADTVKLSDGSSLSGQVTQLDNGDVTVVTGAGTMTVPKDKVAAIVSDGSAAAPAEHRNEYVEKVLERRRAYGNEDGLPRTENLQQQQILFTVGQLSNVGDAFLVKDPTTGATLLSAADLAGLSFGIAFARSYTDHIALEAWGDYSAAAKDFTVSGTGNSYKLQRYNIGIGPKVQFASRVGRVESGMVLIPSIGLTPVWSGANGEITSSVAGSTAQTFNSSSIGASLNGGLDFQFGGALLSVKVRYLLTADVTGNLKSNNTSALLPQIGAGFAF